MMTNRNLVLAVATALPACVLHGCKDDKPEPNPNPDPNPKPAAGKELEDLMNEWAKDDAGRITDAAAAFNWLNEEGKNRVKFVSEDLFSQNPADLHAYVFAHNMFADSDKITAFDQSCFDDEKFESFFQTYDEEKKKDVTIKALPTAAATKGVVEKAIIDKKVYLFNPANFAEGEDETDAVFSNTVFMQVNEDTPNEDAGFAYKFSEKKKKDSSFIQPRIDTEKQSGTAAVNQLIWLKNESVPKKAYNNRVISVSTPYAESLDKLNLKSFFTSMYSTIDMINLIIQQQAYFTAGGVLMDSQKPPQPAVPQWGAVGTTDILNKAGVKTGTRPKYIGGEAPKVVGRTVPTEEVVKKQFDAAAKAIKAFVVDYKQNLQADKMFERNFKTGKTDEFEGAYDWLVRPNDASGARVPYASKNDVCEAIYADTTIANKRSACGDEILAGPYKYDAVFTAAIAYDGKVAAAYNKVIAAMNLPFASRGSDWITKSLTPSTVGGKSYFPQKNLIDFVKVWDEAERPDIATVWPAQAEWNDIMKKDAEKKDDEQKFVNYVQFPELNKHMNSNIISTVQVQQTTKKPAYLEGQVLAVAASLGDAIGLKSNHFYLSVAREFNNEDEEKDAKKDKDNQLRFKRSFTMAKEQTIKHFANLKFNGDDAWKTAFDKVSAAVIAKAKSLEK